MQAIILGGANGKSNSVWIAYLKQELDPYFSKVHEIRYDHWQQGEDRALNIEREHQKILHTARSIKDEPYVVISRSSGTWLTLQQIYHGLISPQRLFGCGVPLRDYDENISEDRRKREMFEKLIPANRIPTEFLQNSSPVKYYPAKILEHRIEEMLVGRAGPNNYRIIPGDDPRNTYSVRKVVELVKGYGMELADVCHHTGSDSSIPEQMHN